MPSPRGTARSLPSHDPVRTWRYERLRSAGLHPEMADSVSADAGYDLHALLELMDRGCAPELAVRITAPLETPVAG